MLVWEGLNENALHPLITQQKQIVRICLKEGMLDSSSDDNFKTFNVLPVNLLFKKIANVDNKKILTIGYILIMTRENI